MKRIENIQDLVERLDDSYIGELQQTLKIKIGESLSIDQIKEIILDTCLNNVNNLCRHYENAVIEYYTIYEVQFTEEFQDDVYYRNTDFYDKFFYLFRLYGYDYIFDCYQERLFLEPPEYIDFFQRAGIFVDPYCSEMIDTFFYHENEKKINTLYEKEKRSDKITNLIRKIKDDARADSEKSKIKYNGNRNYEKG